MQTYDADRYRIIKFPHPIMLFWVLNPLLAFNEIILGQKTPQLFLIDKHSKDALAERQYFPCPHCGAKNNARLWLGRKSFGHWFGLFCPSCGGKIPSLWNLTSILVLLLTFPIWMPLKWIFEKRLIERDIKRTREAVNEMPGGSTLKWYGLGLFFGGAMAAIDLYQLETISAESLRNAGIKGLILGTFYACFMWFFLGRRKA